jgi:uncharacterized protein (TIGR00251 family)
VLLKVIVHPNSKKPRIDKDLLGDIHVYVSAPPLEGKANAAVIEILAKHFKVAKSKVFLRRGQKAKIKFFEVQNSP